MTPRLAVGHSADDVDFARDRVLVERCQRGDTSAFDDLYLRYYGRLCRFCMRRLGDPVEAEDAAQEAFARAWRAMPSFSGERRFYSWLSVIASNLCVDITRRRNRTTPVEDDQLDLAARPVDGGQEALVEDGADRELIAKAMGRVPPRYREVLQLREGHEWSYQQIAKHKGVQVSTIQTLLYRARRSLKHEYLLLADGRLGVAGVIAVLGKMFAVLRPRGMKVKVTAAKAPGVAPAGAQVVGLGAPAATATGAGVGVASTAAAMATVLAVGALAVVASLLPHAARPASQLAAQRGSASAVAMIASGPRPETAGTSAQARGPKLSALVGTPERAGNKAAPVPRSGLTVPASPHLSATDKKVVSALPRVPVAPTRKLKLPVSTIKAGRIQSGIEKAMMSARGRVAVPELMAPTVTPRVPDPKAPAEVPAEVPAAPAAQNLLAG